MQIADPSAQTVCNEPEVIAAELTLDDARILELGCGKADKTRVIAGSAPGVSIVALEVDAIQHALNQQISDLPNVSFALGGAEAIPAEDASFDIVMMFKSLHHVPLDKMDQALREIRRVLKPGGLAWISEPIYAGEFNEIIRLFHDEKIVREAAFAAICRAVDNGSFRLRKQCFFSTPGHFDSFEQFDQRMIQVTHTQHSLSAELMDKVRQQFMQHMTPQGANFRNPLRVDILQKN